MNNESAKHFEIDDWDQHWSEFGETAEKAPALKYRRRMLFQLLNLPPDQPLQILEIGSGQGGFARELASRFPQARFVGLELSQIGVEIAAAKVPSALFLQRNLLSPVQPGEVPENFAAHFAVCSEVLEHVEDPVTLLRNASAYMAPNCKLVVTVPGGPMGAFDKHIGHRKHYTGKLLGRELSAAGFRVGELYDAGFPFFNLYRLGVVSRGERLIQDVSGKPSPAVELAMAVFDLLFRFNLMRWGYQVAGLAYRHP